MPNIYENIRSICDGKRYRLTDDAINQLYEADSKSCSCFMNPPCTKCMSLSLEHCMDCVGTEDHTLYWEEVEE